MPAECGLMFKLSHAPQNQQEVGRMILDDEDGYDDNFAAVCLSELRNATTPSEVRRHRAGECVCDDARD